MNIENVYREIDEIETIEEMNEVIEIIKHKQKELASMQVAINKRLLAVGNKVKIKTPTGKEIGEIIDIKRTKAIVNIEGQQYNCPMSILEAV